MEFRDIIKKINDTSNEKSIVAESVEPTTETTLPSLKKIFESLSEAAPAGMKPMAILDPTNKEAGVGVLSSSNPAVQKMLGGLDPKDVKIVMTKATAPTGAAQQKPGQPAQSSLSSGGGGTAMKEAELDEVGPAEIKAKYYHDQFDKVKPVKAYDKDGKLVGHYRSLEQAKKMKPGHTYKEVKKDQVDEKAKNPYAIGMAAAKKAAGITKKHAKDLPKSVVVKGHEIAKKIKKKEKMDEGMSKGGLNMFGDDYYMDIIQDLIDNNRRNMSPSRKPKVMAYVKREIEKEGGVFDPKLFDQMYKQIISFSKDIYEGDIASTKSQDTMGAGLGAGRSMTTLEGKEPQVEVIDNAFNRENYKDLIGKKYPKSKAPAYARVKEISEGAKPDFLDLDKDGNKKESMKKAAADKKKKVKESMNPKIKAAYHEGYSHGLRGASHSGKRYEDMEEARQYHEGYKCGLDECYGMSGDPKMGDRESPIVGLVGENMPASTGAMATQAMEADMEEGNLFTGNLAKARAAGKTMADLDGDGDMEKVQKESTYTFEDLDTQLNALLKEDAEPVSEGLSVSMSTGQQGSPDSVSVTGTDDEAGKLLSFIKQVGLGGMGGDEPQTHGEPVVAVASDYGAPKFSGHDDMAMLLKKVGADEDYKDEEGHDHAPEAKHGDMCSECGTAMTAEGSCGCDKEAVEEVQTQDQTLYDTTSESEVKEDDGEGYEQDEADAAKIDSSMPAKGGATNEDAGSEAPDSDAVGQAEADSAEEVEESKEEKLDEWANNAGGKGTDTAFEQDIEFMTKVISGGLNKPKVTGQTTIPVISSQDARDGTKEDLASWMKLAGVKK